MFRTKRHERRRGVCLRVFEVVLLVARCVKVDFNHYVPSSRRLPVHPGPKSTSKITRAFETPAISSSLTQTASEKSGSGAPVVE